MIATGLLEKLIDEYIVRVALPGETNGRLTVNDIGLEYISVSEVDEIWEGGSRVRRRIGIVKSFDVSACVYGATLLESRNRY